MAIRDAVRAKDTRRPGHGGFMPSYLFMARRHLLHNQQA
jgi:hypothetical protein